MKKIFFSLLILVSCIILFSCGKTSRDVSANFDRVDALFSQLKYDTSYKVFYDLIISSSEIMMVNSKRSGRADTTILNRKALSLKEKYDSLNYSNYNTIEANAIQQYKLVTKLISKYPEFKTLTEAESKKLMLLSKKYYDKSIKQ